MTRRAGAILDAAHAPERQKLHAGVSLQPALRSVEQLAGARKSPLGCSASSGGLRALAPRSLSVVGSRILVVRHETSRSSPSSHSHRSRVPRSVRMNTSALLMRAVSWVVEV
jgi:hypothetical protein